MIELVYQTEKLKFNIERDGRNNIYYLLLLKPNCLKRVHTQSFVSSRKRQRVLHDSVHGCTLHNVLYNYVSCVSSLHIQVLYMQLYTFLALCTHTYCIYYHYRLSSIILKFNYDYGEILYYTEIAACCVKQPYSVTPLTRTAAVYLAWQVRSTVRQGLLLKRGQDLHQRGNLLQRGTLLHQALSCVD